jgi:hypothetical protein
MPACKLRQPPDCRCRLDDLRIIHAILITAMDAGCDDLMRRPDGVREGG